MHSNFLKPITAKLALQILCMCYSQSWAFMWKLSWHLPIPSAVAKVTKNLLASLLRKFGEAITINRLHRLAIRRIIASCSNVRPPIKSRSRKHSCLQKEIHLKSGNTKNWRYFKCKYKRFQGKKHLTWRTTQIGSSSMTGHHRNTNFARCANKSSARVVTGEWQWKH